jgi:predicted metalloenzyme YecM
MLARVSADRVTATIGDVRAFFELQAGRCAQVGIDVADFPIGHVAHRSRTWREYVEIRDALEPFASANLENVWNGRPISKLVLAEPLVLDDRHTVELLELIPPFHQRVYRMGLEHIGFVVGDGLDEFVETHKAVLTGQQFQSVISTPAYILFDDYSHVKFHRLSLGDVCRAEGLPLDGFVHADWQPEDETAGPYAVW